VELDVRVRRLVVVRDDGGEGVGVLDDHVELAAPEVRKEDRPVLRRGDGSDRRLVELFLEDRVEGNPGAFERRRGDGGTRQAVGVDVRGEEDGVGRPEAVGTRRRPVGEFGDRL
jgi:hypothetical protein